MIRNLSDFERQARELGPKKMAVLAPEDEEFMKAVKKSWELGYIEPVLVGNRERIGRAARRVDFDVGNFAQIDGEDPQEISDLGIGMLFQGVIPIAGKGQIPTSYIYRSIIREEARAASGMTVSVVTFWEIPGIDHLVVLTDTGVNIKPDVKAKMDIIQNALFVYRLLGFPTPRVSILSGQRAVGGRLPSYEDYETLRRAADAGTFGPCEIVAATSFHEIFLGSRERRVDGGYISGADMPHILVVPCLDTGNVVCKLDFFLDVTRSSLVAASRGPVCIPARSDFS
ncbi:MAG: phosphate acyltransferase, partial [Syntrophales bacterium]|nr:phosphate acyltransferase [Syntrophales bacterium]